MSGTNQPPNPAVPDPTKSEAPPAPAKSEAPSGDLPADKLAGLARRVSAAESALKSGGRIGVATMFAVALLVVGACGALFVLTARKKKTP